MIDNTRMWTNSKLESSIIFEIPQDKQTNFKINDDDLSNSSIYPPLNTNSLASQDAPSSTKHVYSETHHALDSTQIIAPKARPIPEALG